MPREKRQVKEESMAEKLRNLEPETPEKDTAYITEGIIYFTNIDGSDLSIHAGKGQQGMTDHSAMFAEFHGICCEERTQYVTDSAAGCIKPVSVKPITAYC